MLKITIARRLSNLSYGWAVVFAIFIIYLVSFGIQYSYGVFLKPIENEFNWSRSVSSSAMTLHLIVFAVSMFFSGWALDKIGPRWVSLAGSFLMTFGLIMCTKVNSVWQLYLFWGFFFGAGLGAVGPPLMTVITRWFIQKRGIATGIATCGVGVGTMITAPITNLLIGASGWRNSFLILGITCLVIVAGASFLFKKPSAAAPQATKDTSGVNKIIPRPTPVGMTVKQAFRTKAMILLCLAHILYTMSLRLTTVHIAPYMMDIGMAGIIAASTLSLIGGSSIIGRLVMGTAQDRIGPRIAYTICLSSQFLSCAWLPFARVEWLFLVFAVVYGFGYGGDVPQMPALVASYFGLANIGFIYGTMSMISNSVGSLGPYLGGYLYDLTGSYFIPFSFVALCSLLAAFCIYFSAPPAVKK